MVDNRSWAEAHEELTEALENKNGCRLREWTSDRTANYYGFHMVNMDEDPNADLEPEDFTDEDLDLEGVDLEKEYADELYDVDDDNEEDSETVELFNNAAIELEAILDFLDGPVTDDDRETVSDDLVDCVTRIKDAFMGLEDEEKTATRRDRMNDLVDRAREYEPVEDFD